MLGGSMPPPSTFQLNEHGHVPAAGVNGALSDGAKKNFVNYFESLRRIVGRLHCQGYMLENGTCTAPSPPSPVKLEAIQQQTYGEENKSLAGGGDLRPQKHG